MGFRERVFIYQIVVDLKAVEIKVNHIEKFQLKMGIYENPNTLIIPIGLGNVEFYRLQLHTE
jgi:hypothetical protein